MSHGGTVQGDLPAIVPAQVLAGEAKKAGFKNSGSHKGQTELVMAVAVGMAESRGFVKAHNDKAPDDSYGLWQINMYGDLGPERRSQFGISENDELFHPTTNARAAYMVFRDAGNSFSPWSVYKSGSYLRYLAVAQHAAKKPQEYDGDKPYIPGPNPDMTNPLDVIGGLVDAFGFITDAKNWVRVAGFVGGGLLLLFGLVMAAGKSDIGKSALNVLPAGRILKAAKAGKATTALKKVVTK